jgi:subtilisin-like proprotein convertase family protein
VQRGFGGSTTNFMVEGDTLTFHSQPIADYPMGGLQMPLYVSDADFPGFGPNVEVGRIRVTIKSLPHQRLGDLRITLTSPNGRTVTLIQNPPYGTGFNTSSAGLNNITLDDAGIATVQAFGSNTIAGTYRAASPLSVMRGEDVDGREPIDVVNGTPIKPWILTVYDSFTGFTGSVQSWSLDIAPAVEEPCSGASLVYQQFESAPSGWDSYVTGAGQSVYWQPADSRGPGRLVLATQPGDGVRVPAWMSPGVPYVPFDNQVYRFSAYISRAGQPNPEDQSQIPNLRLRMQARFAQANTAEYFFDTTQFDPAAAPHMWLNAPSTNPNQPTLYRVDFDPVDVPAMTTPAVQEIRGTIENYSIYPNQQGALEVVEASIERYSAPPDSEGVVIRTFAATDLTSGISDTLNFANPNPRETTPEPHPVVTVGAKGVTLDSTGVTGKGVSLAAYDFVAPDGNDPVFKPGKMYRVRYHLSSDTPADNNPQVRLRARTIKFGYANKLEIGSAKAAGDMNNLIAAQALPGIGTKNPAKRFADVTGGYYDQYFLPPPILPESEDWRKIRFGIDLVDGVYPVSSPKQSSVSGRFTLDSIEIREFDLR